MGGNASFLEASKAIQMTDEQGRPLFTTLNGAQLRQRMGEDGTLMVDADQETGYTHSSYGMVYVDDTQHYTGSTNNGVSKYENGVFKFALVYYVDAGVLTNGCETFTLTAAAESKGYNKAKAYSSVAQKKVYADKVNPRMMKRVSDLQYFAN